MAKRIVMILIVLFGIGVGAEDKLLTKDKAQQITILTQKMEIAQKTWRLAQIEYKDADTELRAILVTVQKPGYNLDITAVTQGRLDEAYVKIENKAEPQSAK